IPLKLVAPFETGTPPVKNLRLRVDADVHFNDPTVTAITADQIVDTFKAGSIVYCPTKAPAPVFNATTYAYAELIAQNVRNRVTSMKAPIGRATATGPELPDFGSMPLPAKFPSTSKPFIVGLYEGGMGNLRG